MYDRIELNKRLASIEGHVHAIRRMVGDGTVCEDVLKQTHAVECALRKLEAELLRGHLSSCVATGFRTGHGDQVTAELVGMFDLARR